MEASVFESFSRYLFVWTGQNDPSCECGFFQIRKKKISIFKHFVYSPCSLLLVLGNTSGLLGLWDGDKEKEFLLPNGTFLDTDSSQAEIHYKFGQKCKQAFFL